MKTISVQPDASSALRRSARPLLLFGLGLAACTPAWPLTDGDGAPACGNVSQAGRVRSIHAGLQHGLWPLPMVGASFDVDVVVGGDEVAAVSPPAPIVVVVVAGAAPACVHDASVEGPRKPRVLVAPPTPTPPPTPPTAPVAAAPVAPVEPTVDPRVEPDVKPVPKGPLLDDEGRPACGNVRGRGGPRGC